MDDLIDNALRLMVSLARLPTLDPTTVSQLLGAQLHAASTTYRVDYRPTGPLPFPTAGCELLWNPERSKGFLLVEFARGFQLPEARVTPALAEFPAKGRYMARTFPHDASAEELAAWDPGRMDVYSAPCGDLRLAFERFRDTDASGFSIDGYAQP